MAVNDEAPVVWTLSHIWVRRILWLKPGQTSEEINYNLLRRARLDGLRNLTSANRSG